MRKRLLGRWNRKLFKPVSTFAWYLWSYSSQFENSGASKYRVLRKIFICWRLLLFCTIRRHASALGGRRRRKKYGRYQDGHFTGLIRSAFHVHSGCFESIGRLCIEGECLRWCGAVMAWSTGPFGSHTNAPLEIWAYLKWNHTYVMKIKLYPHKFRAFMPF